MESDLIVQAVQLAVKRWPGILSYLSRKARHLIGDFELKTYAYYLRSLRGLVQGVYLGIVGGDFEGIMNNLILGQLSDAYETAMRDNGMAPEEATEEMRAQLQGFVESERDHVRGFFEDIVDARVDKTPIDPLLARAEIWANRWNDVYNAAVVTINGNQRLEWVLGQTEEHCDSCNWLNGKVAFAKEWEMAGIFPQRPPNGMLDCGGWNCGCSLVPTDKRRSYGILGKLLDYAVGRSL